MKIAQALPITPQQLARPETMMLPKPGVDRNRLLYTQQAIKSLETVLAISQEMQRIDADLRALEREYGIVIPFSAKTSIKQAVQKPETEMKRVMTLAGVTNTNDVTRLVNDIISGSVANLNDMNALLISYPGIAVLFKTVA